jgi:hypothetical protein
MPVTISEHSSVENIKATWAQIVLALEPLTETLPEPYRSFFESPMKLLIGNKISLAVIPPKHLWSYLEQVSEIYNCLEKIDYLGYDLDFVLIKLSFFLSRLGLSMSVEGKFLLEGPMSQSTQTTRQTAEYLGPQTIQTVRG